MSQGDAEPEISIVIPAWNEARRIAEPVRRIRDHLRGRNLAAEYIIVDDGSTDGTPDVVRRLGEQLEIVLRVYPSEHRGKGHAVRIGMVAARGRVMQQQPGGAMLAVQMPARDAQSLLNPRLSLAADNAPGLCVVAGESDAIAALVNASAAALRTLASNVARLDGKPTTPTAALASHLSDVLGPVHGRTLAGVLGLGEMPAGTTDAARLFPDYLAAAEALASYVDSWS